MELSLTYDAMVEAKMDVVLDELDKLKIEESLYEIKDSDDLNYIGVVFLCHDIPLKKRVNFYKKDRELYLDVILNFNLFSRLTIEEKIAMTVDELQKELRETLTKKIDAKFADQVMEHLNDWKVKV